MTKQKVVSEKEQTANSNKKFWTFVALTAVGLVITAVSVVDGNRVTTMIVGFITIMFALALIAEAKGVNWG